MKVLQGWVRGGDPGGGNGQGAVRMETASSEASSFRYFQSAVSARELSEGTQWAAGNIGLTLRNANRAGENRLGSDQPEDANEGQRVEGKAMAEGLRKEAENMVPVLTTNTKNQDLTETLKLFVHLSMSPWQPQSKERALPLSPAGTTHRWSPSFVSLQVQVTSHTVQHTWQPQVVAPGPVLSRPTFP